MDYGLNPPARQRRASKESTLKGTPKRFQPTLVGLPY